MRGLIKELREVHAQLTRLADLFEGWLNFQNIYIQPQGEIKEDEEELSYRDERAALLREIAEELRLQKGAGKKDNEDE
jgi:8-oxo-dGTP pyrophosphatase MutT (NUDIX family)